MTRLIAPAVAMSTILLAVSAPAFAQETRTEQIEQTKSDKAAQVRPPVRERGDLVITKVENFFMPAPPAVRLTFGDFRPGAGFAITWPSAPRAWPVASSGNCSPSSSCTVAFFISLVI